MLLGTAKATITPALGTELSGYEIDRPARAVMDELELRVFWFAPSADETGSAACLVTADILGFTEGPTNAIRTALSERFDISPDAIWLMASHTHGGPQTCEKMEDFGGPLNLEYMAFLQERLIEAVAQARKTASSVTLQVGRGRLSGYAINRRGTLNGEYEILPNPDGIRDDEVTVISCRDIEDESLRAVLFHYTCHPTILLLDDHISGDYPGAAQRFVEEKFAGVVAGFLPGCFGDIRPNCVTMGGTSFRKGTAHDVVEFGNALGAEIVRTVHESSASKFLTPHLLTRATEVSLPLELEGEFVPITLQRMELAEGLGLVALGGEIGVDYGYFIKSLWPEGCLLPLGYVNGLIGYICPAYQYAEGGYEPFRSCSGYNLPSPFHPETEAVLQRAICDIMKDSSPNGLHSDGGDSPVRTYPLPAPFLGSSLLGSEELRLLTEVVRSRSPFRAYGIGNPHMVDDFEQLAREYFDSPYALATSSGSGALACALAGLQLGPGDEVIIPAYAWFTDWNAVVLSGATPVFADIDRSLCLDPQDVENKVTPRTKAIIAVHYQGACGDLDALLEITQRHNLFLIEDCAQASGATYHGRKLGTFGDVACFSLQQNKIITTGDGGFLLARDARVFERAVRFHDLGLMRPALAAQLDNQLQEPSGAGQQFRMNEFTGAVALAQLRKLDSEILDVTRGHHDYLVQRLQASIPDLLLRPAGDSDGDAKIGLFMDWGSPERATEFSDALKTEGIRVGATSGCCNLLHTSHVQERIQPHPALPPFGSGFPDANKMYDPASCPNTDEIAASYVCVPIVPAYSRGDLDDIVAAINKVAQKLACLV